MAYSLKENLMKEDRLSGGHRMCAGCGSPIAVRTVLRALNPEDKAVVCSATSCLEVSTFMYPYTAWKDSFIHNAFENAAATISGVETAYRAMKKRGKLDDTYKFIAFGGDGTILHASKAATKAGIPVLGVNIGTMGFMAELESSELKELRRLADDDFSVEPRMMLHVRAEHEGRVILEEDALNDAVITKGAVARVVQMSVQGDGVDMMSFSGDGLIVCTPTGSTAYSMSAGGPLVEPAAQNIVLTPICAHDMQTRAIVTSADREITVQLARTGRKNAFLSVDGGKAVRLSSGDRITIRRSEHVTRLLRLTGRSFFEIIQNKFR